MTLQSTLSFAAAVLVFAATPGPAILACAAEAVGAGLPSALALASGVVLGDVLFLLVAVYGLTALAGALGGLFVGVRLLGGGYLIWLGWKMWAAEAPAAAPSPRVRRSRGRTFLAGLLVTLGNPKVILFYLGFLPAFMDLSQMTGRDVATVVSVLVVVLLGVNSAYAFMASRARAWASGPAVVRRLNRVAGSVLMAIGARVALDR